LAEIDESGKFKGASLGMEHGHHGTEVHSSRQFEHGGQHVDIRAVYRILINGVERQLHFSVGSDGKVTTHLRPYFTYDSLVEMVKDVIDHMPDDFAGDADRHDGKDGGAHHA